MENETTQKDTANKPTHRAKVKYGHGKHATYEQIGVAWLNSENGSVYVRLAGKQIVEDGFSLYPIEDNATQ